MKLEDKTPQEWAEIVDQLSDRPNQVLGLLMSGRTTQDCADEMGITFKTVRNHIQKIFRLLGCKTRAEAVGIGYRALLADETVVNESLLLREWREANERLKRAEALLKKGHSDLTAVTGTTQRLAFEAFVAGFGVSTEGWNGEVRRDNGWTIEATLTPLFQRWLAQETAEMQL